MRRVDRGKDPAPLGLAKQDDNGETEYDLAVKHYGAPKRNGNYDFKAYKAADVRQRLEELFHGKCAYCESYYSNTAPVDIEHYRPKGAIEGEKKDQPGYWWLAMDWLNLLPSCIDCNRRRKQVTPNVSSSLTSLIASQKGKMETSTILSGKKDAFPVEGGRRVYWNDPLTNKQQPSIDTERPLLLDPTRDDPAKHLVFHVDPDAPLSLVLPKDGSARGAMSIQVYGLNRMGLIHARTRVMRQLEFYTDLAIELWASAQLIERLGKTKQVTELAGQFKALGHLVLGHIQEMTEPGAPYSALAQAWIKKFAADLTAESARVAKKVAAKAQPSAKPARGAKLPAGRKNRARKSKPKAAASRATAT